MRRCGKQQNAGRRTKSRSPKEGGNTAAEGRMRRRGEPKERSFLPYIAAVPIRADLPYSGAFFGTGAVRPETQTSLAAPKGDSGGER